jgi:hypothetical protein
MQALPDDIIAILGMFAPVFSRPVFAHAQLLLVGAILAPGRRTVAAVLRIMGMSEEPQFQKYHRVLNRACWSSRQAAGILLRALVDVFGADPLVIGIDETLERRRGARIQAKGIYRDAVRSSRSHFAKASGLRWISMMLLAPIPWANRVWALPFFTVLAPSQRYHSERGLPHKTLADWARQMVSQLRRWLPERPIVLVADGSYAVLALLRHCAGLPHPVTVVTRLRLDARLFAPAPARKPGTKGRPRKKGVRLPLLKTLVASPRTAWRGVTVPRWYSDGPRQVDIVSGAALWYQARHCASSPGQPSLPLRWVLLRDPQGKFEPQALLCTDLCADPVQIISWFVLRWQMETTFQAVRTHLGVETQRQWNDNAIARTTPALMALFSLVTLMAHPSLLREQRPLRQASWYLKLQPTFADAIACVRRQIWLSQDFVMSSPKPHRAELIRPLHEHLVEALCYAA